MRNKPTVNDIVETLLNGMSWYEYAEDSSPDYIFGSEAATAHIGACMITSITKGSTPTQDVVDMIEDFPKKRVLTRRVKRYIGNAV